MYRNLRAEFFPHRARAEELAEEVGCCVAVCFLRGISCPSAFSDVCLVGVLRAHEFKMEYAWSGTFWLPILEPMGAPWLQPTLLLGKVRDCGTVVPIDQQHHLSWAPPWPNPTFSRVAVLAHHTWERLGCSGWQTQVTALPNGVKMMCWAEQRKAGDVATEDALGGAGTKAQALPTSAGQVPQQGDHIFGKSIELRSQRARPGYVWFAVGNTIKGCVRIASGEKLSPLIPTSHYRTTC